MALGANTRRVGVCFFPFRGNAYGIVPDITESSIAPFTATILAQGAPVEFWLEKHGSVVQAPWFVNDYGGGTCLLIVLEVYADDD
jgi:hypothetical protein